MEYDIFREKLVLKYPAYGHALWQPTPGEDDLAVEIGDVGFIREGRFHRLFNVLPPKADGPDRGSVPLGHKPFKIGNSESPPTSKLHPNHFCSKGVSKIFEGLINVPDENSFVCSTGQGAILCLPSPVSAQREDILAKHEFGKYMLKHLEEWFTFARNRRVGIVRREDIVLVTGRDLAKTWANIVFQEGDREVKFKDPVIGDSHIEWKFTPGGVAYNIGPSGNLKDLPENQCIFVRGFRATRIKKIFPGLRAAAGPVQVPSEDDLDADMQLISFPDDTRYQEPFYTLLKYIAIQAPDCDMALIHDDDLQLCIDSASLDSLQPDTLTTFLRRSAPKVWQVEWDCSPAFDSASTAESLPRAAAVKVAMFANREVKHVDSEPGSLRPIASVVTDRPPTPIEASTLEPVETPVVAENRSPIVPPAASRPHCDEGVQLEGFRDNIAEVPDAHLPVVPLVVIKDPPTIPLAVLQAHPSEGVKLEGFDGNIAEVPLARLPAIPLVVIKDSPPPPPSMPLATPSPDPVDGVSFEDLDNIMGDSKVEPEPVTPSVVNPTPSVPSAPSGYDRDGGVQLEGMHNIIEDSNAPNASGSSQRLTVTNEGDYSRWLPLLREFKQRLEQATEGKIERNPHPIQPFIPLSIYRWTMRLLMSAASLVPSAFAHHSGFLGPVEATPYYPTGDLSGHRGIAFSTAMNSVDDLEAHIPGGDDVRIATKLVALAQALSDLGLHDYAFMTSGFALDALQRPYIAEPNNARLHVASVLSLRANILCDLKNNDEANDAAERAVTLCMEHKNSQTAPVPELAYALLNHAVILNAIDLNEGSAAVAFELLSELDESRPETKDILALCKLCVSTSRIGADNDMATSMADETINLTRMSLDANSQIVLVGALLAKSQALSSKGQNDAASPVSAEAVELLRNLSVTRPVFSLFLAHALDVHAHHLSETNCKLLSYLVRQEAVEHWQTLKATAGSAVAQPLARSLSELAKFHRKGDGEFGIAESAVEMFLEVESLDVETGRIRVRIVVAEPDTDVDPESH